MTENVPVYELLPYPGNARKGDVEAIRKSIRQHGFLSHLVVQRSTGYILIGNHRHEAACLEGYTELPVLYMDVTDEQARRIVLDDNRTSDLGGYDSGKLAELLNEVQSTGGLEATVYADAEDLAGLLSGLSAGSPPVPSEKPTESQRTSPTKGEAEKTAKTGHAKPGELWIIESASFPGVKHILLVSDPEARTRSLFAVDAEGERWIGALEPEKASKVLNTAAAGGLTVSRETF